MSWHCLRALAVSARFSALGCGLLGCGLLGCGLLGCGQVAAGESAAPSGEVESAEPERAAPAAPAGKRTPCTLGADQTCNDDERVSALWGRCTELGVCECAPGFELNPGGRCQPQAR